MKEYLPVIATISGALIAIAGGILLHWANSHFAKNADRRRITREKLEDTYRLSLELEKWALDTLKPLGKTENTAAPRNTAEEIVLLTNCYSENCADMAVSLKTATEALASTYFNVLKYIVENDEKPPTEEFNKLEGPFNDTKSKIKALQSSLVAEIRANR
jgi:hypothetical protein